MVLANGDVIAAGPVDADVAVFNSCTVTADAEAELRKTVRRAHRENPAIRSVIMGCAPGNPSSDPARRLETLPGVESLVVGADMPALAKALGLPPVQGTRDQDGARGLLRIQDGCDEHCTFCATTLARGRNRSRSVEALLEEAEQLSERHREIVLTGVHIGTYGHDAGSSLGALLEALVERLPSVRFRLSSVEATEVDDRIGALMAGAPRHLAPYLHAPLQSGSDHVLRKMGRHWYTADGYRRRIDQLAERIPLLGLGADIITGFPGERPDDHALTLALVRALPFTGLHVFPYSPRDGTAALRLPDAVPPRVARERAAELRELASALGDAHARRRAGARADSVVIGGVMPTALTEDYLSVRISNRQAPPRGTRCDARLELRDGALCATDLTLRKDPR